MTTISILPLSRPGGLQGRPHRPTRQHDEGHPALLRDVRRPWRGDVRDDEVHRRARVKGRLQTPARKGCARARVAQRSSNGGERRSSSPCVPVGDDQPPETGQVDEVRRHPRRPSCRRRCGKREAFRAMRGGRRKPRDRGREGLECAIASRLAAPFRSEPCETNWQRCGPCAPVGADQLADKRQVHASAWPRHCGERHCAPPAGRRDYDGGAPAMQIKGDVSPRQPRWTSRIVRTPASNEGSRGGRSGNR